jgi:hypothetical protein
MLFYLGLRAWVNGGSGWELAADYATNPDLAADYADGRRSGRKADEEEPTMKRSR